MNILWLASWFPNRTSPFNGDFVQRHADAVAPFVNRLTIITVVKDESLAANAVEIEKEEKGNQIIYKAYYGKGRWGNQLEKITSLKKYLSIHQQLFRKILSETGQPDLVHVHVAMKAGLFALKLKEKYNIPFIVTEHWTAYAKDAKPSVFTMGKYFLRLTKKVLTAAALVYPVSKDLGETISKNLSPLNYKVIPNVVNTEIFFFAEKPANKVLRLIHVSTFDYQKNAEDIIEALAIWKQAGAAFEFQLFGPVSIELLNLIKNKGLEDRILFIGEVKQPILAKAMQQCDALILYSRYETFGCVVIEANACGIPAIVSDLPVFHELVQENVNGLFAKKNNPVVLANVFALFAREKEKFNQQEIAKAAKEKFNYATVGKQFADEYQLIINNRVV